LAQFKRNCWRIREIGVGEIFPSIGKTYQKVGNFVEINTKSQKQSDSNFIKIERNQNQVSESAGTNVRISNDSVYENNMFEM
jgi:hypothetical protein